MTIKRAVAVLFTLLLAFLALAPHFQNVTHAATPTDYYLIAAGTTPGSTVSTTDDLNSYSSNCTLRDAVNAADSGQTTGSDYGCAITLIGSTPATPTYVINLPVNYTYTLYSNFRELPVTNYSLYIIGQDPNTTIIQTSSNPNVATWSLITVGTQSVGPSATFELDSVQLRYSGTDGTSIGALNNYLNCTTTLNNVLITQNDMIGITNSATLNLNNTTITNGRLGILNSGWVYATNSTISYNGTIINNSGGINSNGIISLTNTDVTYNTSWTDGAGINNTGTITATGGNISHNRSNTNGGGLANSGNVGNATFSGTTFAANSAPYGGAIYNTGMAKLTLQSNTIIGDPAHRNYASHNGAGLYNTSSNPPAITNTQLIYS